MPAISEAIASDVRKIGEEPLPPEPGVPGRAHRVLANTVKVDPFR